jgi:hypothetical protein
MKADQVGHNDWATSVTAGAQMLCNENSCSAVAEFAQKKAAVLWQIHNSVSLVLSLKVKSVSPVELLELRSAIRVCELHHQGKTKKPPTTCDSSTFHSDASNTSLLCNTNYMLLTNHLVQIIHLLAAASPAELLKLRGAIRVCKLQRAWQRTQNGIHHAEVLRICFDAVSYESLYQHVG